MMNNLWNDYLTALGYSGSVPDMIVRALRERVEPPPLSGTVNDLWYQYLSSSTGVQHGTIDDLMARHLRGLGYSGAVPDMLRKSLIAGDFFGVSVCVTTLTHDIVDADPSYLPADIDGNQFSLAFPTPGFDPYAASTSITDLKSLPASGTVWVEFRKSDVQTGFGFQLVDAVTTDRVNFIFLPVGEGFASVSLYDSGDYVGGALLSSLWEADSLMIGYNSAGELFVMDQYGVPRNVTEFPVDNSPLPPAPLSGFTAIAFVGAIIGSTELTGTASGQFVTDYEQFPYPPEGEAYDWCGGQIPLLPVYKSGLTQALADAGGLNPLNYTAATWNDVESAITAGQLVLDDDEATQLEVNNAIRTITTSINNLVEWTPAEEFSNGELGAYFDPEDTSTLFQDSAGTTPVTGDGQPVGLMLDKSGNDCHRTQDTTAAKPTFSDNSLVYDNVDDVLPFPCPEYTGNICVAIAAVQTERSDNYSAWRTRVDTNSHRVGAASPVVPGINPNSPSVGVVTRVNGKDFEGDSSALYVATLGDGFIGVCEGYDPSPNLGALHQTIQYRETPRAGGTEFAYIEVEKPAFDDLPRLEHWLAKKAGVTL